MNTTILILDKVKYKDKIVNAKKAFVKKVEEWIKEKKIRSKFTLDKYEIVYQGAPLQDDIKKEFDEINKVLKTIKYGILPGHWDEIVGGSRKKTRSRRNVSTKKTRKNKRKD